MEVSPSTVRIAGTYDMIKDIEFLNTEPIDLTGATEDYTARVALVVPEGIEVLDGNEVSVTVKIEENLTLAAWPWVFAGDSNEEGEYEIAVRLYVDLRGEHPGDQEYQVLTEVPADYQVVQLSAQSVRVVS